MPSGKDVVIVGLGQLGALFHSGALLAALRVRGLRRGDDIAGTVALTPEGTPIVVAVGEADLAGVAALLPDDRKDDAILMQNELLWGDWREFGFRDPTFIVVWTSQKRGQARIVGRGSRVCGRHAAVVKLFHESIGIPCVVVDEAQLATELAAKMAFILTVNALGMARDTSVGDWLDRDNARVHAVVSDALTLVMHKAQGGAVVDENAAHRTIIGALEGFRSLPARGRTAADRVRRALTDADRLGVSLASFPSLP